MRYDFFRITIYAQGTRRCIVPTAHNCMSGNIHFRHQYRDAILFLTVHSCITNQMCTQGNILCGNIQHIYASNCIQLCVKQCSLEVLEQVGQHSICTFHTSYTCTSNIVHSRHQCPAIGIVNTQQFCQQLSTSSRTLIYLPCDRMLIIACSSMYDDAHS